jgi:predicted aminopeptidase
MQTTEQAREQQLLNIIDMAGARLRSMFATIVQSAERAAAGHQVEADLRLIGADIVQIHDWMGGQLSEAMSDAPLASAVGAAQIIAMGIPEPVEVPRVKH